MKYNHIYGIDIESTMSHIDVVFTHIDSVEPNCHIQGGMIHATGMTLVTVIRRGSFAFDLTNPAHPSYWAEKLGIQEEEAEEVIRLARLLIKDNSREDLYLTEKRQKVMDQYTKFITQTIDTNQKI
jgi:hypothetical protein